MEKEFVIINNIEYVPKLVPDWDKLIELIDKAKGPERSVREFAALCDKSPATFTRIVQKSYRKRLDQSFISKIFENATDQAGITLEDLVRANGYIPKDEQAIATKEKKIGTYIDFRETLLHEIGRRKINFMAYAFGASFLKTKEEPTLVDVIESHELGFSCLIVKIDELNVPYRVYRSCILPEHLFIEDDEDVYSSQYVMKFILHIISKTLLLDAWRNDGIQEYAFSFVFKQETAFDVFVENKELLPNNHTMTAVLINPETQRVIREEIIPGKCGECVESIFDFPIQEIN